MEHPVTHSLAHVNTTPPTDIMALLSLYTFIETQWIMFPRFDVLDKYQSCNHNNSFFVNTCESLEVH